MSRLLFIAALAFAAPALAQTRYAELVEDFPLPPGFERVAEFSPFAAEGGRIVGLDGIGRSTPAVVRSFYEEALPPLGWSVRPGEEPLSFQRDRQRVTLIIEPAPGGAHLHVLFVEGARHGD